MIRAFLRIALPVVLVAAAGATLVGPAFIAGPPGEPLLLVSAAPASPIERANLGATDCASLQLLAAGSAGQDLGVFALRVAAADDLAIARIPDGAGAALLVIFDGHGDLMPLTGAEAAGAIGAALSTDCAGRVEPAEPAGAI
jgi:hypothetical protein